MYGEILNIINAAYKHFDVQLGLNVIKTKKHVEVIKPLLQQKMMTRSMKGSGLIPTKIYTGKKIDYVYWNKPKELVDRLRLLYSSKWQVTQIFVVQ